METDSEIQARLDEQIARDELALCHLRAKRNTFSLIFRLPQEILAAIFIHYARGYYYSHNDSHSSPSSPQWFHISHVCHHWRQVALDCPDLWSYISVTSLRWMEEMLARSKQASLRICVKLFRHRFPLVEQAMVHLERIQDLCLHIPRTRRYNEFFSNCSLRAPRLQILEISVDDTGSRRPPLHIPWDTPALRTLKLESCAMSMYSFGLSRLTTLSLHGIPDSFRQDVGVFLAMLLGMQDIRHLYLEDAIGSISRTMIDASLKINLSRLSRVYISGPLTTVVPLLSHIDIPLSTEIRLECDGQHNSTVDYTHLIPILAHRLSLFEDQASSTIRTMVVKGDEWELNLSLAFSTSERDWDISVDASDTEWDRNIPLKLALSDISTSGDDDSDSDSDSDSEDYLSSNVCCALPLTQVQCLHIVNPQFSLDFWRKLLDHLPELRYLKLSGGGMPDLASVLQVYHEDETHQGGHGISDQDPHHILVPALEELALSHVRFSTSMFGRYLTQAALFDALSTRNVPGGRLLMTRCLLDGVHTQDVVRSWDGMLVHVLDSGSSDESESESESSDDSESDSDE